MVRSVMFAFGLVLGVVGTASAQAGAAKGKQVFTDQKCGLCHSVGETGNKKGPLDEVGTKLSADDIRQWIVNSRDMTEKTHAERKPPMKEFKLPKGDVDALVAYLQTLKKKP